MEANGIAVVPEGDGSYTVWVSTQVPFDVRDDLADTLGVERDRVRAIAPDVGGGSGPRGRSIPSTTRSRPPPRSCGARPLARDAVGIDGRAPARPCAVRHDRARATRDGAIVGLRAEILADMGAYPIGAFMPITTQEMLSGVYRIRIVSRGRCVVTNTTPIGAYRGAGRPEAAALIERAVDLLAGELEIDPVELRRRNSIPPDAFPHTTASGARYDSGDYAAAGRGAPHRRVRGAPGRTGAPARGGRSGLSRDRRLDVRGDHGVRRARVRRHRDRCGGRGDRVRRHLLPRVRATKPRSRSSRRRSSGSRSRT